MNAGLAALDPAESPALLECSAICHPFFADMSPERARQFLSHAKREHYRPDEIIFRERGSADRFYLVQAGTVALEADSNGHGTVHIDTVVEGEVFGWSWLFPPFAWHFRARAVEQTDVIACDAARLLVIAEEDPAFGYDLMRRICTIVIRRLHSARNELAAINRILNPDPPELRHEPKRLI